MYAVLLQSKCQDYQIEQLMLCGLKFHFKNNNYSILSFYI